MNREEILSHVDHTLLKPEATWPQIQTLCDEAIANHTASVCINTCYVKQAVEYMAGRIPVCCVVGFPLGAMDTASKAFEAKTAIENGAAEVDMVINIGRLKNGEYDAVREDIRAVKQAVGDKILKVIIETCLLTDDEKRKMCDIVCEAGADYIKTSTGFSTAGANFHDVELCAGRHHQDVVARFYSTFHHADVNNNALVAVIVGVKNQRLKRSIRVAFWSRNIGYDAFQNFLYIKTSFSGNARSIQRRDTDDVLDLLFDDVRLCAGQIDLVDDRHYIQIMV